MKVLVHGAAALLLALAVGCAGSAPVASSPPAHAGSLARFVAHGGYLYCLDDGTLNVYSLAEPLHPALVSSEYLGWQAETVFAGDGLLFLGTRSGLMVHSLRDPARPTLLGAAEHIYSCDPVVVDHGVAYVTLYGESQCQAGLNELQVFDVGRPDMPRRLTSVPLTSPRGLGVDGSFLVVVDEGLKIFDVADPAAPRLVQTVEGVEGYDVIPNGGLLVVSAQDGIHQYRYDRTQVRLGRHLSRIPVASEASTGPEWLSSAPEPTRAADEAPRAMPTPAPDAAPSPPPRSDYAEPPPPR